MLMIVYAITQVHGHQLDRNVPCLCLPVQVGDFGDTMFIPQIGRGPNSVQMRFQPGPFSGYAVMHW
jgi:hypothetical protein